MTLPRAQAGTLEGLLEALARRPAAPGVANPYAGPGASARLRNLRAYLGTVAGGFESGGPRVLLVGEAPGYRGCAVTGVPFTSRQVLASGVEVGRWGLFPAGEFEAGEALGRPWAEATATLVWRHLPGGAWRPPRARLCCGTPSPSIHMRWWREARGERIGA